MFFAASVAASLSFAFVTPPYQVSDEAAHFFRSYRVSEGSLDLFPRAGPDRARIDVPSGLLRAGKTLYAAPPFRAEGRISHSELRAASRLPIGHEREEVFIPNALVYTFVPYVPQALGIAVARELGSSALGALYAGRIANAALASVVIAFAIARAPSYRWLLAALALTPMAVALRGSLSPDATVFAVAALLVAEVAALAWGSTVTAPPLRRMVPLVAAAAVLCAAKLAYLPLCLLVLLIPAERWPMRRAAALALYASVVVAATSLSVIAAHSVSAMRFDVSVDPAGQVLHVLSHPLEAAFTILHDAAVHAPRYASQLIGKLGWLDVPLPPALLIGFFLLLVTLLLIDGQPSIVVRAWQRLLVAALTVFGVVAIIASQYVMWTPVGASFVEGVQGRYFLPVALVAIWSCHGGRWARGGGGKAALAILTVAVSLIAAFITLAVHFFRW